MKIYFVYSLLFTFQSFIAFSQNRLLSAKQKWVNNSLKKMTLDEKIGQLFMVQAYSNKNESHALEISQLIKNYHLGGIAFFQGGPVRQALLINRFQKLSKIPLFVAMDLEWGLGMRLDSTISFPRQMTLGAIGNNHFIYQMGAEIARQCKRLGVNINFAPVADINTNSSNPVIGTRSFGENKIQVAEKTVAYMKGMQDNEIIAIAKHFPGHGDTYQDSHITLPTIQHSRKRIESEELYPFNELIKNGIKGIMTAHLYIPTYDKRKNIASSLSKKVVTDIAIEDLNFEGLIFTDALNMQAITKYHSPKQIALQAFIAGNDILLMPKNLDKSFSAIKTAVRNGQISEKDINKRVRKILNAKWEIDLSDWQSVAIDGLYEDLNNPQAQSLNNLLHEQAVTLVKNKNDLLPFVNVNRTTFASIAIGIEESNLFQEYLNLYTCFSNYQIPSEADSSLYQNIFSKAIKKQCVVVSLHNMNNNRKKKYGISSQTINFIKKLKEITQVVVVIFGNAYSLKYVENVDYLLCAYEDSPSMQKATAQILFGAITNQARLPVSVSDKISFGSGKTLLNLGRLRFGLPESVGLNSKKLKKIDTTALMAVEQEATPGCQVLIAKNGKVIFWKSYGYHTYKKKIPVSNYNIYDVASLTKILAPLQIIMSLEEQGFLDINKKVGDYLPETNTTNKASLLLKNILTHQAGLIPFIKYKDSIIDEKQQYNPYFLSNSKNDTFSIQVSSNLFARYSIQDSIWQWNLDSEVNTLKNEYDYIDYRYSDVGFYILKRIIENITQDSLQLYLKRNLYKLLGLQKITYLPLEKLNKNFIIPTELDTDFRKSLVHGYTHDLGAALSGGVAAHAGIFSNALDIAIIMQMNLQNGYYGGRRFFQKKTLSKFNTSIYKDNNNRRGIGWDKPMLEDKKNTSKYCSDKTFGHTGFTGNCVWVDPKYNLIYIFLSNRVYPYMENWKLNQLNIRTKIHDLIYEALK